MSEHRLNTILLLALPIIAEGLLGICSFLLQVFKFQRWLGGFVVRTVGYRLWLFGGIPAMATHYGHHANYIANIKTLLFAASLFA